MEPECQCKELMPNVSEINYIWYYMQTASIMAPDVRRRLRAAWGFCERHAWMLLMVESSMRHSFLMGPAVLYGDLLGRASSVLRIRGPMRDARIARGLRDRRACLMCSMDLNPVRGKYAGEETIRRSRDPGEFIRLVEATRKYWEDGVCGICRGDGTPGRCRRHLIEDLKRGMTPEGLDRHRDELENVRRRLDAYGRSCRWEHRGTADLEDKAGLIRAVGWCSGWQPLLRLAEEVREAAVGL
ncbi:MAG: hypothetical protein AVO39_04785 [delta proteobacterium MLS_D]|jgi:hypothetical protein|nr:MAG: hypothetical protein AVO39_04785 [delta proteobacterium MLS_D]